MAYLDENGLKAFFDLLVEKGDLTWYDEEEDGWKGVKSSYATNTGGFDGNREVWLTGDVTGGYSWSGWGDLNIETTLSTVSVNKGGTGATDAATALTNLGALSNANGAVGTNNLADGAVTVSKLDPSLGLVSVSSAEPTDEQVFIWIEV